MSVDKLAISKVYTTFNKSLGQTAPYTISPMITLTKQTILPIIQKAMPIILTLFSTKNVVPIILKLFWE